MVNGLLKVFCLQARKLLSIHLWCSRGGLLWSPGHQRWQNHAIYATPARILRGENVPIILRLMHGALTRTSLALYTLRCAAIYLLGNVSGLDGRDQGARVLLHALQRRRCFLYRRDGTAFGCTGCPATPCTKWRQFRQVDVHLLRTELPPHSHPCED